MSITSCKIKLVIFSILHFNADTINSVLELDRTPLQTHMHTSSSTDKEEDNKFTGVMRLYFYENELLEADAGK